MFKVHSLEYFLYVLKNGIAGSQVVPALSLCAEEIERDVYDFTIEIACEVSIVYLFIRLKTCSVFSFIKLMIYQFSAAKRLLLV